MKQKNAKNWPKNWIARNATAYAIIRFLYCSHVEYWQTSSFPRCIHFAPICNDVQSVWMELPLGSGYIVLLSYFSADAFRASCFHGEGGIWKKTDVHSCSKWPDYWNYIRKKYYAHTYTHKWSSCELVDHNALAMRRQFKMCQTKCNTVNIMWNSFFLFFYQKFEIFFRNVPWNTDSAMSAEWIRTICHRRVQRVLCTNGFRPTKWTQNGRKIITRGKNSIRIIERSAENIQNNNWKYVFY